MIVSLVRFTSTLSEPEVQARIEERADGYRRVPGLVEKVYLRFRETGEVGAMYVWESEDALRRFRESDLARSIPVAYEVEGEPGIELADVLLVVRPASGAPAVPA
jgi:heme-degrading monooxygenase HmoA